MRKALILFFVFLLALPIVFSAPPVTTTQQFSSGYIIETPIQEYLKTNQRYTFNFHVFNISDGMPILNKSSSCYFHLYNSSGNHILELSQNINTHNYDFEFKVETGNFSKNQEYRYVIQCNSSFLGGYTVNYIKVTKTGEEIDSDNTAGISIMLFLLFVIIILIYLGISDKELTKTDISNVIMKRSCIVIALYLMVMNMGIIMAIANNAGYEITNLNTYMWLFGMAGYIAMIYLVFKTLIDVMLLWDIRKKNKRTGEE